MKISITIDDHEVKNPIAKLLISLFVLVIFLAVFIVLFFLVLPFIWFAVLSILLAMLAIIVVAPKVIHQYKVILIRRKTIEHNK